MQFPYIFFTISALIHRERAIKKYENITNEKHKRVKKN